MDFELTTERQDYLDARKYTILLACPGSGKTTCIVQKLKTITRECEQTHSRGVGVLCLSFTNKACEEIKQKYRMFHGENLKYPHEVCTIDSFVTRYILMPFWYLYKKIGQKPSVINEKEISRSIYYRRNDDGEEVLLKQFLRFGRDVYRYKPEDLTLSEAGYKFIGKSYNKMVLADAEKDLSDYSKKVWEYRIEKGILNSTDTLWVGKYIIEHNPEIAQTLAQRFPYIVVDEAQDTSKWQFDIFETLRNGGVENMEFVGDLNQSIYEWREAKPSILKGYTESEGWNVCYLTQNRRSVQRIIDFYSRLKPIGTPPITSYHVEDKGILIDIFSYNEGDERNILSTFEKKCQENVLCEKLILARGTSEIKKLSATKSKVSLWKRRIPYQIIDAQISYHDNEIKAALKHLKWAVVETMFGEGDFDGQKAYITLNDKEVSFNVLLLSILSELPPLSSSFEDWEKKTTEILQEKLNLGDIPNFNKKKRLPGFNMKQLVKHPISLYFGRNDDKAVVAQTIHSVKGASVDAVLLFIDAKNSGKGISVKQIPVQPDSLEEMDERHRLIYVACSRAKQYLALAVPSTISENKLRRICMGLDVTVRPADGQLSLF